MQTSLGSQKSVLEAMQPLGLAQNLPSMGQLIPLPFCGVQSAHSHGPVWDGSADGVCALSQILEAGWEGEHNGAMQVCVPVSGCSCVSPQVSFKTSPNSSASSEEPSTPAMCVVLEKPLWVGRRNWKRQRLQGFRPEARPTAT